MKKLILTFLIIFHQFSNGTWMIGYSVPGVNSYAMNSEGTCVKYAGEVYKCSEAEIFSLKYLAELEKSQIANGLEYTSYKE